MAAVVIAWPARASDSYFWSPRTPRRWAIALVIAARDDSVSVVRAKPAMVAAG